MRPMKFWEMKKKRRSMIPLAKDIILQMAKTLTPLNMGLKVLEMDIPILTPHREEILVISSICFLEVGEVKKPIVEWEALI